MNILHNEFPELDKTYGGFKYFFIIYIVCIECIRILTFKFVLINFCSVCVKIVLRVGCAWVESCYMCMDNIVFRWFLVLRLCFLVYCLACYIPVSPVYRHRVVLIVSRHPSL